MDSGNGVPNSHISDTKDHPFQISTAHIVMKVFMWPRNAKGV